MNTSNGIHLKNILMLTVAGCINAFGVVCFLYPVDLYDSGVSGTSMLLSQLFGSNVSLSLFLIVLNVPLFLYGLRRQGKQFTIYAIFAVAVYSAAAWLITEILPVDVSIASPLAGTDLLLCALFGGVISGLGSGLALRFGGAMDGIEVMAVIFAKRMGITVGSFCMIYNVILYIICGLILRSWILPLYSIVTYGAALKTVDFVVEGFDRAKAAMIVTGKPKEICAALGEAFHCGATILPARGAYSGAEQTVVYFVVNRFQVTRMRVLVRQVDPTAYITMQEVTDIFPGNRDGASAGEKEEP